MSSVSDPFCERARAWASLDLDGDLADIERLLLDDHVTRCEGCAAAVEGMRSLTAVVRATPLERPERTLVLPLRRRPAAAAVRALAVATIVALAAGLGVLGSSLGSRGRTPTSTQPEIAFLSPAAVDREIKRLRARDVAAPRQRIAPPGRQGGLV